MRRNYNFTAQTFDRCRHDHFTPLVGELSKLEPSTPWDKLKVGDVYHLPNLLVYKRADFVITEIKRTYINGMLKEEGSDWKNYSLFKNEVRAKFLIKRIQFNKV